MVEHSVKQDNTRMFSYLIKSSALVLLSTFPYTCKSDNKVYFIHAHLTLQLDNICFLKKKFTLPSSDMLSLPYKVTEVTINNVCKLAFRYI